MLHHHRVKSLFGRNTSNDHELVREDGHQMRSVPACLVQVEPYFVRMFRQSQPYSNIFFSSDPGIVFRDDSFRVQDFMACVRRAHMLFLDNRAGGRILTKRYLP